ncbi:outer membrane beta-barrel family protein [Aureibacter tunicatorum]|nr:outer membrane beta-barrel family protein [Aureibacter tunicatorum]
MLPIRAQHIIHHNISGRIIDENKEPVSFANAALLFSSDSTLVNGTASDEHGFIEIKNIEAGKYLLKISAIGYEQHIQPISISLDKIHHNLGEIIVRQSIKELESVEVIGQRQVIERKIDRLVFNVENTILTSGADGLEILSKTPGIIVDHEGNIKIHGKDGVVVMINDKRSYLTGKELSDMLKSMSADNISSIEVITNPSARYDAEGNAGILNIVLKEMKEKGYNGSIYAGINQGKYPGANTGANFNFRAGKFSGYLQADYRYYEGFDQLYLEREVGQEAEKEIVRQDTYNPYDFQTPSLRIGLDYDVNEKNIFGIMFNGYTRSRSVVYENITEIYNHNNQHISDIWSDSHSEMDFSSYSFNLNYIHKFDTLGQRLSVDLDYSNFENAEEAYYKSKVLSDATKDEIEEARSYQPYEVRIVSSKLDYEKPIGLYKLESGLKFSHSLVDNDVRFDSLKNNEWVIDKYRTNDFTYEEAIPAGYVNFSGPISKKITFQSGLRVEHTITNGRSKNENKLVDRKYTSFFPSLFLKYDIDDDHSLSYSYSRRVRRPTFSQLNPFLFFLDPFTGLQGNPYLKPEFTNNLQLDYIFSQKYAISLSYTHTTDVLNTLITQDNNAQLMIQSFANIDQRQNYSININIPVSVSKWWEMSNSLSLFGNRFKTDNEYTTLDQSQFSAYIQNINTFLIGKTIKAEFSGWYQSPSLNGSMKLDHIYEFTIGLEKSFFDERLSINAKARDAFRTLKFSGHSIQDNVTLDLRQSYDSNRYQITLRYNFTKGTKVQNRTRSSGNKEEQNRVE